MHARETLANELLSLLLGMFTVHLAEAVALESSVKFSFFLMKIFRGNKNEAIQLVEIDITFKNGLFMTNSKPEIPSLTTCNHLTRNSVFSAVVVSIYLHAKGLTPSTSISK